MLDNIIIARLSSVLFHNVLSLVLPNGPVDGGLGLISTI